VVECLSDKCEALNSNPSVAKIKEKIARKFSIFENQILYFEYLCFKKVFTRKMTMYL
jgi:hypothetical protein